MIKSFLCPLQIPVITSESEYFISPRGNDVAVILVHIQCLIITCMQAMSPDGEAIVTGAGDETLRFWNVFSKMRSTKACFLPISHFLCVGPPWMQFSSPACYFCSGLCLTSTFLLSGISLCVKPLHQDPVVCTVRGIKTGRESVFACLLV